MNFYDYGARNYNPAIGRWMSVDPLAEQFPNWNPYHYVHNNPINLIDPTGMAADGWRENKETGEKTFSKDYTKANTPKEFNYADEILSGSEGKYYDSSGGITDVGTVLPEIEMTKKSSLHPYYNAVPSVEYGAYTPDGFGFSIGASIVWDKYHNFDVFLSYSGAAGFNAGGVTSYLPSFSATMDFYENNDPNISLFKGIRGTTYDFSGGYGMNVGYSRPVGGIGVHKASTGIGGGVRAGKGQTVSLKELIFK
ncbi:RHS repeat-associated core domain-containing protein [Myroides sp. LJL119]